MGFDFPLLSSNYIPKKVGLRRARQSGHVSLDRGKIRKFIVSILDFYLKIPEFYPKIPEFYPWLEMKRKLQSGKGPKYPSERGLGGCPGASEDGM